MDSGINYSMRSIAFITELIHPPMNYQAPDLQKIHSIAFADPECQYQNFQMLPMGAQLSNPPGATKSISSCAFLNDRIQVREEMTGISYEDYTKRLEKLVGLAINHLQVPMFVVSQFIIRTLVNTQQFKDSREFVAKGLLNMEPENFEALDRNGDILGLRLALSKPDKQQGLYNLRIESYSQDARSLFIENVGTYQVMIKAENLQDLTSNFYNTYTYIESNVVPFLLQFDDNSM